jgi:hypothetical protein
MPLRLAEATGGFSSRWGPHYWQCGHGLKARRSVLIRSQVTFSCPSRVLRGDECNAASMRELRGYRGPRQVHPRRLLQPSLFQTQWKAWWPLSWLLGVWKHTAAAVAVGCSQT